MTGTQLEASRGDVAPALLDIEQAFEDLPAFQAFLAAHPALEDPELPAAMVAHGLLWGVHSSMLGFIPPEEVRLLGANFREAFMARSLNPRLRAVLEVLSRHPGVHDTWGLRIHAHEALTPLALLLRGRYARFLGTEYAADAAGVAALFPIPAVDVTRSGLPSDSFDVVMTNEVLEHVPDLDAALRDMARILRPGGRAIGTFPLRQQEETEIRAVLQPDGMVRHLAPPEYHGNPVDPEGGSLVFQVPGWDVLARARRAGFARARFIFIASHGRGIMGTDTPGILVFEAER